MRRRTFTQRLGVYCVAIELSVMHVAPASAQTSPPRDSAASAAELPPEQSGPYDTRLKPRLPWIAVRGSLGLGAGGAGLGGRAAVSASVWPSEVVGASVEYQAAADGTELFGANDEFVLFSAGPSVRFPWHRFYAQTDLLFGAGHGDSYPGSSSLLDGPPRQQLSGLAVTVIESVYWHPSVFELGPSLEVSVYDQVAIGTLSFAFGVAL